MRRCRGPRKGEHLPRCSPRRPRCRWNRKKGGKMPVCECGVYHFPHRKGSGMCGKSELMWERIFQPVRVRR